MKKKGLFLICFLFCMNSFAQSTDKKIYNYETVEVKPQFPGGINEFMKFVIKNYQPPEEDEGNALKGTVTVDIEINSEGNISKITIVNDLGNAGKEIKRVLSKSPKWTPGRNNFENVTVVYQFPVKIQ
jgi:Gram-negative bacterial TonB protein C-terminal